MREYLNEVWDKLGNFFNEHRVMVIPIIQNKIENSLSTTSGILKFIFIQGREVTGPYHIKGWDYN